MSLPRVEKSLCGCTVETGSKIVGWLNMIGRALTLIFLISLCFKADDMIDKTKPGTDERKIAETALVVAIVVAVFVALSSIFDILLLTGIYKKRPSLMLPWIVVQIVGIIFSILSTFQAPSDQFAARFGGSLVAGGISSYFVVIVNSHYQNLKSETHSTPNF